MRPIARFSHLMSSTVLVARRSGLNSYGEPSGYGADASYPAHVRGKRQLVRNAEGQEVVSSQMVYVGTRDLILPTDRITLSTADVGSTDSGSLTPPILAVERRFDEVGPHHTVVYLA